MRLRYLIILLIGLCLPIVCSGQTYTFNWQDHKTSFLTSSAFWAGSMLYERYRPLEIINEYEDINPSSVWSFDSGAINQNSVLADTWSDYTLYASIATPIIGMLSDDLMGKQAKSISMMALQGIMFESGLTQFVKSFAERPRPYVYRQGESILYQEISKNSTQSFYSGHTSTSAYFSFFSAKVFSDLHPNSKWKPVVWTGAALLPAVTGYLRYKAGKHFPSDVITGYLVGATFGVLIPEIYKNDNINLGLGGQGLQLSVTF